MLDTERKIAEKILKQLTEKERNELAISQIMLELAMIRKCLKTLKKGLEKQGEAIQDFRE